MYPQHTDFSQPTPTLPKTNPQSTSPDDSRNSSAQSSLPCGQRTPAASTSSSGAPSSQTPPQTFTTSHQPQFPTKTQNTSPSLHKQHTPSKTNIDQSSQSSIAGEDQQRVPKSADGTRVKRSKQQPRQPDKRLCFHCNLPGHLKRNCPKIPYCSKCRTKGHAQDKCINRPQKTRHAHPAGEPRDQQRRKDNLPQFSSHHNKCLQCAEITRLPTVRDHSHHLLILLLLVQVSPLTKTHLVLHAHLLILIRIHPPHTVNLHFMYGHPLST